MVDVEKIDHEGPKEAVHEKIDDAQPNIERVADIERHIRACIRADQSAAGHCIRDQEPRKHEETNDDEQVTDRYEPPAIELADDTAEEQNDDQRNDGSADEKPAQIVHSA